ncbi:hypothetical protein, partial [uncultured Nostoc sp.]|uniref:hypothetical protein n=1 Tax=uncultured Nostoc sp. TaxID=340711 RepID=UPI0035CAF17A
MSLVDFVVGNGVDSGVVGDSIISGSVGGKLGDGVTVTCGVGTLPAPRLKYPPNLDLVGLGATFSG